MKSFTEMLQDVVPTATRRAVIDVAVTMEMGQRWFHDHGLDPTEADLLKFAELVLSREPKE